MSCELVIVAHLFKLQKSKSNFCSIEKDKINAKVIEYFCNFNLKL